MKQDLTCISNGKDCSLTQALSELGVPTILTFISKPASIRTLLARSQMFEGFSPVEIYVSYAPTGNWHHLKNIQES